MHNADGHQPQVRQVSFGDLRRLTPISRYWGYDRGPLIDRYYIERFLAAHADDIAGRVLEIGDAGYTRQFGGQKVIASEVLNKREDDGTNTTIVADLARADHMPSDTYDCIILTQTLQYIFDLQSAIRTLRRILRPGGVVLVTTPGISKVDQENHYHWCWSFTAYSLLQLFQATFPESHLAVEAHGNVLAATAFLHGLSASELRPDELDSDDCSFPVTIALRAVRP